MSGSARDQSAPSNAPFFRWVRASHMIRMRTITIPQIDGRPRDPNDDSLVAPVSEWTNDDLTSVLQQTEEPELVLSHDIISRWRFE